MRPAFFAVVALVGTVGVAAWPAHPAAAVQRAIRQQQVIVSIVDRDNKTVTGLTPADLGVREDDVAREVIRIEPATAPMQIALLVDSSEGVQEMVPDLRKGIQMFAALIWAGSPGSDIALMEFGERPAQLADFSKSPSILDRGLGRLSEHRGSGAYLLEAIIDAAKNLKKREAKRGVIVAFLREASPEFSTQQYQEIERSLKDARVTLWVSVLQGGGVEAPRDNHDREVVVGDVTTKSGGMRNILLDRMGIEHEYQLMADRLTSQYAVTYGRPESLIPPSRLDVTVKRAGARVLAPRWTGQ